MAMKVFTVWGGFADEPGEHFATFRSLESALEYRNDEQRASEGKLILRILEEEGDPEAIYADDPEEAR